MDSKSANPSWPLCQCAGLADVCGWLEWGPMKKYTVEWLGAQTGDSVVHTIEAENNQDAFDAAAKNYKYPSHPRIEVCGGFFNKIEVFDNSHFDPNYVEPVEEDSKMATIPRSDGSVGWYENLGENSLSDRGILLAQLHELRTIKRCVACTALIVIVIPVVFGLIRLA